ncbi:hypothetical protein [Hellea balneolensis]|uniref:hypothetical protein n=1 Tax=Hellea balneolensis TaxID=287478 RepID=UPI0004222754|nr:hypothetical protein [Hellea balneolensis]
MPREIIQKTSKALTLDGAAVVPALIDLFVFGGVPISTVSTEIAKGAFSNTDKFIFRKTIRAAEVILHDLESGVISPTLLEQVFENLKSEHGEEYFNESLFHAIQNADSQKRASYIGNLISSAIANEMIRESYFDFLAIVQTLTMKEIELLKPASQDSKILSPENKSVIRPVLGRTNISDYRAYYRLPRLLRYQSVGLTRGTDSMGDANIPLVDNTYADLFLKAIGEIESADA